jgi:hypothetical protein
MAIRSACSMPWHGRRSKPTRCASWPATWPRRRRQGADRCRCRCGQGRHRAGLDLHHARCRRCRRAAAFRRHGAPPMRPRSTCPVIADGGIKYSGDWPRRSPPAPLRDGRLAARRHRGKPGRGLSAPGPLLQGLSRHGLGRRHGARLGGPLLPGRGDATRSSWCPRASRARFPTRGRSIGRSASAHRRPQGGAGLCRRGGSANFHERATLRAHHRGGPARKPHPRCQITRESPNYNNGL